MNTDRRIPQVALLALVLASVGVMTTTPARGSGTKHRSNHNVLKRVTLEGELQSYDTISGTRKSTSYSFKIAKAKDEYGRDLNDLLGQSLRLSQKGKTEELLKRHQAGDKITIQGTVILDQKQIEVTSFKGMGSSNESATQHSGSTTKE